MNNLIIRPLNAGDLKEIERLYEICLLTGDNGKDATSFYQDPTLIGTVYVGQYAALSPEFCLVVVDEENVVQGYAVGTPNSAAFEDLLDAEWWPDAKEKFPLAMAQATPKAFRDAELIRDIHDRPTQRPPVFDTHPAHFHIDLLPSVQGSGIGRKLLESLLTLLKDAGAPGVHLGVGTENTNAQAFYKKLGFREHSQHPWGFFYER